MLRPPPHERSWRNWQTRSVEVAVGAIPWRFKSSRPHQAGRPLPGAPPRSGTARPGDCLCASSGWRGRSWGERKRLVDNPVDLAKPVDGGWRAGGECLYRSGTERDGKRRMTGGFGRWRPTGSRIRHQRSGRMSDAPSARGGGESRTTTAVRQVVRGTSRTSGGGPGASVLRVPTGIARRSLGSDGRCEWSERRLTPDADRLVDPRPLVAPAADRFAGLAPGPPSFSRRGRSAPRRSPGSTLQASGRRNRGASQCRCS